MNFRLITLLSFCMATLVAIKVPYAQTSIKYDDIKTELYSCNLAHGKAQIDENLKNNPDNPYLYRLLNHYDFLLTLFFESETNKTNWLVSFDERLDKINTAELPENEKLFLLSEAYLQGTLLNMISSNELKAVKYFRAGFDTFQALEKTDPNSPETAKIRGLYNFFLGSVPEKYNWVVNILGMDGDFQLGLENLKTSFEQSKSKGDFYELGFYYAMFSAYYGENSESLYDYFIALDPSTYKNPLMRLALAFTAEAAGKTSESLTTLIANTNYQGDTKLSLLDYQIGSFLVYNLQANADIYLKRYIDNKPKERFDFSAHRILYWHFLIQNNSTKAEFTKNQIIAQSQNAKSEHERFIVEEISSEPNPNINLLKARLQFNGGNYSQALASLKQFQISGKSQKEKLEYYFRLASIKEKLSDYDESIKSYKQCIVLGKDETWHFAPKASINLADIYKKQGKSELAEQYYKLAIKINQSIYKESINQEAKQKLKQL